MSPPLYLHIGLPKTATTFWQLKIFPRMDCIRFVHPSYPFKQQPNLLQLTYKFLKAGNLANPSILPLVQDGLRSAIPADPRPLLLSRENFSVLPSSFWDGKGPSPMTLAEKIRLIEAGLDGTPIRIIWGIRNAPEWLASRYCQSALRSISNPSQADFEERLKRLCSPGQVADPCLWLNQACVKDAFADYIARGDFLELPMEKLTADPEGEITRLGAFLGQDMSGLIADMRGDGTIGSRVNVRRTDKSSWALPGSDQVITLSADQRTSIDNALQSAWPPR